MITRKEVESTLSKEEQEFSIYALGEEFNEGIIRIYCNIPKLARKWRKNLESGTEVYNSNSGQLIEIHGVLKTGSNVSIKEKRVMSEEERIQRAEHMKSVRASVSKEKPI